MRVLALVLLVAFVVAGCGEKAPEPAAPVPKDAKLPEAAGGQQLSHQ